MGDVTELLKEWSQGCVKSEEQLFALMYPELRKIASARRFGWPFPVSVQTTELVNEAYLRLVDQSRTDWRSRSHFLALSATFIRRILLDRARRRLRLKRGAGVSEVSLDWVEPPVSARDEELLALDQALVELARIQSTGARVVELRFFGGQSIEETASILGLGSATVVRRWRFAKAWLAERLGRPN
ncbi:MAG: ECF-type sigma factor [Thermoanaerobaculia bacterium]|nr:ECF-type sigma factor [Thermoanaerobaculia bacterium]